MRRMIHVVGPILAAGVMPYALTGISKSKGFGATENKQTRAWQGQLTGWQQRAYWAHQNAFEALPLFAAMTILAYVAQPASAAAAAAAWSFVGLRVAYSAAYIADRARLRSGIWFATMAAVAALGLVALRLV